MQKNHWRNAGIEINCYFPALLEFITIIKGQSYMLKNMLKIITANIAQNWKCTLNEKCLATIIIKPKK